MVSVENDETGTLDESTVRHIKFMKMSNKIKNIFYTVELKWHAFIAYDMRNS